MEKHMKRIFSALGALLVFGILSAAFARAPTTAKIAFTSTRNGNSEIYIMNPDGSQQKNLTEHPANDHDPVWSPTGEEILFVSDRGGVKDLYLMKADGTQVRKVFRKLVDRENPTWSPDGRQLAYHRYSKIAIYVASRNGADEKKLVSGLWPAWSPDGSEIAYVGDEAFAFDGEGRLNAANPRVQFINLQSNVEDDPFLAKKLMFGPAWSPNSNRIAFSWIDLDAIPVEDIIAGKDVAETEAIYVANRDGSGIKQIVDATASGPVWAPRADELIYEKWDREVKHLFKITIGGDIPKQLTRRGNNFGADWFDPAFALPVSPQPQSLTTVWGKMKLGK